MSFAVNDGAVPERNVRPRTRVSPVQSLATVLTVATLAWGALAFGAVYPWGFWSMAVLAVMAGTAGLLAAKADLPALHGPRVPILSRGFLIGLV